MVCLTEMLPDHRLEEDEFYERFLEDVEQEACVFSNLVNVVIPRPGPSNVDPVVAGVGRVFLEYSCLDSSNLCKIEMGGSWWGEKQIVARFYPEDKFAAGDYGYEPPTDNA